MANVRVRSLTVFHGSAEGAIIETGNEFEVSEARADELMANGLVEKVAAKKAEPAPEPRKGRG